MVLTGDSGFHLFFTFSLMVFISNLTEIKQNLREEEEKEEEVEKKAAQIG